MQIHHDARTTPRPSFSKGPRVVSTRCSDDLGCCGKTTDPTRQKLHPARSIWFPRDVANLQVCRRYRVLGGTYRSKGRPLAISRRPSELCYPLSAGMIRWLGSISLPRVAHRLFFDEDRFGDAYAHIERANSHPGNDAHHLGRAMELHAGRWIEVVDLRGQDALRRQSLWAAQLSTNLRPLH